MPRPAIILAAIMTLGLLPVTAARSQIIVDAPGFLEKKRPAGLPDVKPAPLAWPRLDRGAALCRSEDDLARLALRRQGQDPGGPVDCRTITAPTAITIMRRNGPGRTQLRLTDAPTVVGWTDVWLPERAPSGAGQAAR